MRAGISLAILLLAASGAQAQEGRTPRGKEPEGLVLDSSGNANHGLPAPNMIQGIAGLWGTKAASFHASPVRVDPTPSLDNIQDQLTVEPYVCFPLESELKGGLVHREGSFRLAVENQDGRVHFTLFTSNPNSTDKVEIASDLPITPGLWVYVKAVYDGTRAMLYIDDVLQSDIKAITGKVKLQAARCSWEASPSRKGWRKSGSPTSPAAASMCSGTSTTTAGA